MKALIPQKVLFTILVFLLHVNIDAQTPKVDKQNIPIEGVHYIEITGAHNLPEESLVKLFDYSCKPCFDMSTYLNSDKGKMDTQDFNLHYRHVASGSFDKSVRLKIHAAFMQLEGGIELSNKYFQVINDGRYLTDQITKHVSENTNLSQTEFMDHYLKGDVVQFLEINGIKWDHFWQELEENIPREFVEENGIQWSYFVALQNNQVSERYYREVKDLWTDTKFMFVPAFIVSGKYLILDNWQYIEISNYLLGR